MPNEDVAENRDDLENTLIHAHSLLRSAINQPSSPLRAPVLASICQDAEGTLSAASPHTCPNCLGIYPMILSDVSG